MSPRAILLGGTAAIAVLVAIALVVVARPDRSGAGPSIPREEPVAGASAPDPEPEPAAIPAAAPDDPGPAVPVRAASPPEPLPDIVAPRPHRQASAAARVDWESVPMVARVGQLGPDVSGPVLRGLAAARAQMDACFADEAKRLARGEGPAFDPADPPTGPAVLTLMLQSRPGGVDVVDSQVVRLGTSTAALTSCVQQVLKGWPIDAPAAAGSRRYRLRYTVQ